MKSLASLMLLFAGPTLAQGTQFIEGVGNTPCGELVRTFDAAGTTADHTLTLARFQWAYGYLSAWNDEHGKLFKARYGIFGDDGDRARNFTGWWMYDVCQANPKATLADVTREFIRFRLEQEKKR
jgi:hypothetical protein